MQYAFQLNMSHKKKKPSKQKLVGQKVDLLFFHPTKECLQFLYVTIIEVLQSVKNVDTVGFIPGTGKEFLRVTPRYSQMRRNSCIEGNALPIEILRI